MPTAFSQWKLPFVLIGTLFLVYTSVTAADVTEKRTGISFPDQLPSRKRESLASIGVRTKGPFKVYAVGQYGKGYFLLKMNMDVNAQKMSSALVDALSTRCQACGESDIKDFESLLLEGLPNGAKKGTQLLFGTVGRKLTVTINDKSIGNINSKELAAAFANIYTDKNAVCQLKSVDSEAEAAQEGKGQDMSSILIAILLIICTSLLLLVFVRG